MKCPPKFLNNKTFSQFALLLSSRFASIIIGIVSSLVLTHVMQEEVYGAYKYGQTFIITITSFISFGIPYSASRLLVKEEKSSLINSTIKNTTIIMMIISMIASIISFCILLFLYYNNYDVNPTLFLVSPLFFTILLQEMNISMLQGANRISEISIVTIFPSVFIIILMLITYFFINLIPLNIAIVIFGLSYALIHWYSYIKVVKYNDFSLRETLKSILAELKESGLSVYIGSLIGVSTGLVINMIVGKDLGMIEFASYSLAITMSSPLQQVPSTMGAVLFRENYQNKRLSFKNISFTIIISLLILAAFFVFMLFVFPLIFSAAYNNAINIALFLVVGFVFLGFGDYFNRFLGSHGQGHQLRTGAFITGISQIILIILLAPLGSLNAAIISRIFSAFFYMISMVFFYYKFTKEVEGS